MDSSPIIRRPRSGLTTFIIIALILSGIFLYFDPREQEVTEVPLSTFVEAVKLGEITSIHVSDNRIESALKDGKEIYTIKESSQSISDILEAVPQETVSKIKIQIEDTESSGFWMNLLISIVPFLLIVGFFIFMFRQAQSSNNQALSFGKSRARLFNADKKKTTFADVAGAEESKAELIEIVDFLKNPAKYQAMGAKIPKGVLLVGLPGTGKTLIARAVAGEANVPFFNISGSEFVEMFVGVGASVTGDTPVLIKDATGTRLISIGKYADQFYRDGEEGFPIMASNVQALGFESEETGFRGITSTNGHHFFGGSKWQSVKAVYRHKVNRIYKIHYLGGVIKTTADHSVFVRQRNMVTAKRADELKVGDTLVNLPFKVRGAFISGIGTTHKIKAHKFFEENIPRRLIIEDEEVFVKREAYEYARAAAGSISQHTLADTFGVSQGTISNWQIGKYEPQLASSVREAYMAPLPHDVELTPELCKLFGFYTAEGSANGRLEFTFGTHETNYHEEVISLMKKYFDLDAKTEAREDNAFRITYYSSRLGKFFEKHCGNGSHNKHIPEFLWDAPAEYFLAYLEGYAKGDGYTTKEGKLSVTSVSKQLIQELAWLASMHGIQAGIRENYIPAGRIIHKKPLPASTSWNLIIGKTSHPFEERGESPFQFKKPRITKIEIREYNDYVYDLCGCGNEAFFGGEKPILFHNSRVRDLFRKAKRNAPCIVFIDEIDAVGRQRGAGLGGGHDEREQTLNQILTEMDGFETDTNIIVVAATNRPDVLDPALLRPGRFDRRVVVDQPDIKDREAILAVHARGKPLSRDVDLGKIARQTSGFVGADLENLMNEAALLSARHNKKKIGMKEVEKSIEKVLLGPERKSKVMSKKEKEITAYHEVGHAIVAHLSPGCDPVHKVSIISRGMALGVTWFMPEEDKHLYPKSKFEAELASLLGGYTAEEIIFGREHITTGASNDLEKATNIARKMVMQYGMSELGPVIYGDPHKEVFLGRDFGHVRNYSEEISSKIDHEIKRIIANAYDRARNTLIKWRKKLDEIAEVLLQKETLTRSEFLEFFQDTRTQKTIKIEAHSSDL